MAQDKAPHPRSGCLPPSFARPTGPRVHCWRNGLILWLEARSVGARLAMVVLASLLLWGVILSGIAALLD